MPLMCADRQGAGVADTGIAEILERPQSRDPLPAREGFLDQYSPVLFQASRAYASDTEMAADCYLNICEQLALHNFRRLLKFKPEGSASFKTWLQVVARNLCLDWHRKRAGRRRPFKSIQSLSELEFRIYICRFERGLTTEETLEHLRPISPDLGRAQVEVAERRIAHCLSSRQRWMLTANGINDSGQIVGTYVGHDGKFHGFIQEGSRFTTIDCPRAVATIAGASRWTVRLPETAVSRTRVMDLSQT